MSDWISVKEAAAMLGYTPDGFRKRFCDTPIGGLSVLIISKGRKRRSIRVLRADVESLVSSSNKAS